MIDPRDWMADPRDWLIVALLLVAFVLALLALAR